MGLSAPRAAGPASCALAARLRTPALRPLAGSAMARPWSLACPGACPLSAPVWGPPALTAPLPHARHAVQRRGGHTGEAPCHLVPPMTRTERSRGFQRGGAGKCHHGWADSGAHAPAPGMPPVPATPLESEPLLGPRQGPFRALPGPVGGNA